MKHNPKRTALISSSILAVLLAWVLWVSLGFPFFGVDYLHLIENVSYLTILGGFCGGIAMFVYSAPIGFADSFVRVVVCVMTANMLTQLISQYMTKAQTAGEMWGVAFMVGFVAFPLMSAIARFFENRRSSDITDMVKDFQRAKGDERKSYYAPPPSNRYIDDPDK